MSLSQLISPFSLTKFLETHWEIAPLHIERENAAYFTKFADMAYFEDLIWRDRDNWGSVSLAKSGMSAAENPYAHVTPTRATLREAYAHGFTVVLNNVQDDFAPIRALCRSIEQEIRFRCTANLYLTSPGQAGLSPHYDDQDVFVLQLTGQKIWSVYPESISLPLESTEYKLPDVTSMRADRLTLNGGDTLYVPRGVVHSAIATTTPSLHLTLSIMAVRWVTFLRQVLNRVAADIPELRRSVPRGLVRISGSDAIAMLRNSVARVSDFHIDTALGDFQDLLLESIGDCAAGAPHSHVDLRPDTPLKLSEGQIYWLTKTSSGFRLKFIGGEIGLTSDLGRAIERLCMTKEFCPNDLLGMSESERVAFAQILVNCGFWNLNSDCVSAK